MSASGEPGHVVVVGAGQAGAEVVAALRQGNYPGAVTLIGDEALYPYSRPPLSKAYLKGSSSADDLLLRRCEVYERHDIDVRVATTVSSIDPEARTITLTDGDSVSWSQLVLATGGSARTLPGLDGARNVHYMRTKADADVLRVRIAPGRKAVVIGGGYVGLEFAAVARTLGVDVTVIEVASRLLARVSSPIVSKFYEQQHRAHGVKVLTGCAIDSFDHDPTGAVTAIRLASGEFVPADFVVVGIGMVPRTELAEAAGLTVADGVIVDAHMRTSAPDVSAVGDVARFPDPTTASLLRLESVPNATEQAKVVAATILARPRPYEALPWFWSDQYDLKLQVAGVLEHGDELVVRGDPGCNKSYMVLHLREGRVRCAEVVNDPAGFAAAKRLIASGRTIPVTVLGDSATTLKEALARV